MDQRREARVALFPPDVEVMVTLLFIVLALLAPEIVGATDERD